MQVMNDNLGGGNNSTFKNVQTKKMIMDKKTSNDNSAIGFLKKDQSAMAKKSSTPKFDDNSAIGLLEKDRSAMAQKSSTPKFDDNSAIGLLEKDRSAMAQKSSTPKSDDNSAIGLLEKDRNAMAKNVGQYTTPQSGNIYDGSANTGQSNYPMYATNNYINSGNSGGKTGLLGGLGATGAIVSSSFVSYPSTQIDVTYEIKNLTKLEENNSELSGVNEKIKRNATNISYILQQIKTNWQNEAGSDLMSIIQELETCAKELDAITPVVNKYVSVMNTLAQSTKTAQNNSL